MTMYHLRVALALCLSGILAALPAQEREQTNAVLEGDQRNINDILKQSLSRHRRRRDSGAGGSELF